MPRGDLSYQSLLETVLSIDDALVRCYRLGGLSAEEAAFKLNIRYPHFQRMMNPNDNLHFPPREIENLMRVSGNLFPLDFLESRFGRVAYNRELALILDEIRNYIVSNGGDVKFALRALMEKR